MPQKSRNQVRDHGRRKGGISEIAAVGAAMAGGAIGATVAAGVTTGELKKRLAKLVSTSPKRRKEKRFKP